MKLTSRVSFAAIAITLLVFLSAPGVDALQSDDEESAPEAAGPADDLPATLEEARGRARLLHETIHGTLQVMHRDFFDPDDGDRIPSASLEDVFEELAQNRGVEIRWLGVNATTMDIDHEPRDDFERDAVSALSAGDEEFEAVEDGRYRRVGVIVLHNVCLKCHVPARTHLEDRAAGLAITMRFGRNQ